MAEDKIHRFALVIGNAKYPVSPLKNPTNDANALGKKLLGLGFDVRTEVDLTADRFRQVVGEFCRTVAQAGGQEGHTQAVLFYAGHGVQVDGENFLLPLDGQASTKFELKQSSIGLDILLEALGSCARTSIVLLDCCRDNPLPRTTGTRSLATSQGLANVRAPKGVYVAFATQPHFVALDGAGNNSPFTEALIEHVDDAAKHVSEVLMDVRKDVYDKTQGQQIPWDHSALFEPFIFANADPGKLPGDMDAATRDRVWRDQEKAREESYWKLVQKSRDTDVIQNFVSQFPNSTYRSAALARLDTINSRRWMRVVLPLAAFAVAAMLYFLWVGSVYFRMIPIPDSDISAGDIEQENGLFGYEASLFKCRLDCVTDFSSTRQCVAFSYDEKMQKCYPKFEAVFFARPSLDGLSPSYSEVVPGRSIVPTETTYSLAWDRGLTGTQLKREVVHTRLDDTSLPFVNPADDTQRTFWALRGPDCQRACLRLGDLCKGFSYTRVNQRCELFESVSGFTREEGTKLPVHVPGTLSGCSDPGAADCKSTIERRQRLGIK